jgi:Arc/MetJ-type ribon-helix-helix transcriptional regulator
MTISVRLDDKTKRRLSRYARARGVSQSEIVRQAIDALLNRKGAATGSTLYERMKDVIGSVRSGRRDLSQNTGDQFYEILLEKKRQGRL